MAAKVLIVRFSSIGDIVLTTPVIRCIREQTGAEVHFLTKASFAGVLAANPYLARVWTIQQDLAEVLPALRAEAFDHIIDLHGNLRTLLLKARLFLSPALHLRPRPGLHTFNKLNGPKFLLTRFGVDRMPGVHIVDRYLAAAAPLGVKNDGRGLDFHLLPADAVDLAAEGLPPQYLAFVIGAAHATKCLTEEQMAAFCQQFNHPVILLGGPAERAAGERIAAGMGHVTNACGRFSLRGSADLIRQAQVVVTHDTGLMHIAAAFRRPIVSVWGNTVPALGMYPYLPGEEATEKARRQEVLGLSCRPCSKIGYQQCPKGHFRCIRDQDPTAIVRLAEAILATNGRR